METLIAEYTLFKKTSLLISLLAKTARAVSDVEVESQVRDDDVLFIEIYRFDDLFATMYMSLMFIFT